MDKKLVNEQIIDMINKGEGYTELNGARVKFDCWSLDEFYTDFDLGFDIYFDEWNIEDLMKVVDEIMDSENYDMWLMVDYRMDIYIIGLKVIDGGSE